MATCTLSIQIALVITVFHNLTIINFNKPNGADAQCNFNRSGLLCGQCKQGYSLSAGSLNCLICPKHWLAFTFFNILVALVSGVIMVALFVFLNLTVALGTVNGIIFYANIVLINRSVFLPFPKQKLIIFLYILNTRLGVHRCVYEGMDANGNIWLSLLFPSYLICLVIIIIILSPNIHIDVHSSLVIEIQWQPWQLSF